MRTRAVIAVATIATLAAVGCAPIEDATTQQDDDLATLSGAWQEIDLADRQALCDRGEVVGMDELSASMISLWEANGLDPIPEVDTLTAFMGVACEPGLL